MFQRPKSRMFETSNSDRSLKSRTLPRLESNLFTSAKILFANDFDEQGYLIAKGELLGLKLKLHIPFTQVGASKNGKIFTQYVIRICLPPPQNSAANTPIKTWDSKKRYSQFVELDKNLKSILNKKDLIKLASLPPKRFMNSFEDNVIEERKTGFTEYLQSCLIIASTANDEVTNLLAFFLEMPGTKPLTQNGNQNNSLTQPPLSSPIKGEESSATTVQTLEGEAHHGFLFKRGGMHQNKPFKIAFCVLNFEEGVFRFYRTSRPQLLGAVQLKDQVEASVEIIKAGELGIPDNCFGFRLFTPERELIMYANTIEDRNSWITAINQVISKNNNQTQQPVDDNEHPIRILSPMSDDEILVEIERKPTPPRPLSSPKKKPKAGTGTPLELAQRELAYIDKIREDWAIDWEDLLIQEKIGGGAFGTVYKGKCWGTPVAVKQLNTSGTVSPELKLALQKEVGVLSKLRHPNILLYIGAASNETNAAMVTEWCEKASLFELLKNKKEVPMTSKLILKFALEVARGMSYLHSRKEQIIHRDLKSLNILITDGYVAKVADFGLTVMREATQAKQRREDALSIFSNSDFFGTEGTAQWMAPEVMEGGKYNHKVDVYSYGILLTELLTKKMPFKDLYAGFEFVDAVLDRAERPTIPLWVSEEHGDEDDIPIDKKVGPSALGYLVIRCTNRDPVSRPDFVDVVETLEMIIAAHSEIQLFEKFDLPRLRENLESGDYEDVSLASQELSTLTREILFGGISVYAEQRKMILRKFIDSLLHGCFLRLGYGKASRVLERGGEYEQVELEPEIIVDLICCVRQMTSLSVDPSTSLQSLFTPKKDPLNAVIEWFLKPSLDQRGVESAGGLLSDLRNSSPKNRSVFEEVFEPRLDEAIEEKKSGSNLSFARRRTIVVSDREILLWRCRAYELLPNKFSKKLGVSSAKDEVKTLEAEIRSMELSLFTKRRQFLDSVKKYVNNDVGKV